MVLTKTDTKFIQDHSEQIMDKMKEYRKLTGTGWHPFNYDLGYENMKEWYGALLEEIKSLKK